MQFRLLFAQSCSTGFGAEHVNASGGVGSSCPAGRQRVDGAVRGLGRSAKQHRPHTRNFGRGAVEDFSY